MLLTTCTHSFKKKSGFCFKLVDSENVNGKCPFILVFLLRLVSICVAALLLGELFSNEKKEKHYFFCCDDCRLDVSAATIVAFQLQNLGELYPQIYSPISVSTFKPFVQYARNLMKMAILSHKVEDNDNDLVKLNAERQKLANAKKLIIFIKDSSFVKRLEGIAKDVVDFKTATVRYGLEDIENESPLNVNEVHIQKK